MDNEKLQKLVERISLEYFKASFKHEVKFNSRLRSTGGRYFLKNHNIDINPKIYIKYGTEALIGVIKHELCHYHLHLQNSGHQHRDRDFKKLLKEVKGLRYAPSLEQNYKYIYKCQVCSQRYFRKRKISLNKYACSKCHGKLKMMN